MVYIYCRICAGPHNRCRDHLGCPRYALFSLKYVQRVTQSISVYALFNKSRRIAIILGSQMALEYVMLVIMVSHYFPRIPFIPYCILAQPPYQIIYHTQVSLFYLIYHFANSASSIVVLTTQSTLIGLTLIKHILARRAGWGRTPLVSLLIRDGTATYFVTSGTSLNYFRHRHT